MPKLVHKIQGKFLEELPLKPGKISIGRKEGNDICLEDRTVSSKHAIISVEPSPFLYREMNDTYIEDLGSTNGTKIEGKNIKRELLKHGDIVKIGDHEFEYVDENKLRLEETMVLNTK